MKFVNLLVFSFACVLAAALDSLAQTGTVNFANGAAGVDAPITHAPGQAVEGPDWRAELLYLSGTNFVPVGERIPFETNTLAGYFFGGRKIVQENFGMVILMIIFISILPGIFEYWRERKRLRGMK